MNELEHLVWLGLPPSESARACRACGQGVRLDDPFGLSEGVCAACRVHAIAQPAAGRVRAWLRRTRRAA